MNQDSTAQLLSLFLPQEVSNVLAPFLSFLPARVIVTITCVCSIVIAAANIARIWWTPPKEGTKASLIYALVAKIAAKKGFNAGAYGPGFKSLAIPADADRTTIAEAAGVPPKNPKDAIK